MKLNHTKFLLFSLFLCSVFCMIYYALFRYQLGNYVEAEWWLSDLYSYKDHLAQRKKSPRILITGGSNCLFGINSDIFQDRTGYEVVNLASHAALDFDFHYYKVREHMQDGDIVLLPLEYEYYTQNTITDWFADNMMAWGKVDYLDRLSLIDQVNFIFHVPKKKIYEGILNWKKEIPIHDESFIIDTLSNSDASEWKGYGYESINRYGEMGIDAGPITALVLLSKNIGYGYIRKPELSEHFLKVFRKFQDLVNSKKGMLILTWPPSIKNKQFDLAKEEHVQILEDLRVKLAEESIQISCQPEVFNLDVQYFFNTHYHLNKHGAAIRSENLAICVRDIVREHQ